VRISCFLLESLAQAESFVLSDKASRLGEPSSPQQEIMVRWVFCLARHLGGEVH